MGLVARLSALMKKMKVMIEKKVKMMKKREVMMEKKVS
jgi:hypothetical protein